MLGTRRDIVCRDLVELITDYLEDSLPRSKRAHFEQHLRACENCSEYLVQMRATIAATGRLREDDLTPAMREEFGALFVDWMQERS